MQKANGTMMLDFPILERRRSNLAELLCKKTVNVKAVQELVLIRKKLQYPSKINAITTLNGRDVFEQFEIN